MLYYLEALNSLVPNAQFSGFGEEYKNVEWHDSRSQPTEAKIQAKIAELTAAEPMRLLRVERDRLIALTDWRFRSDLTPSQAWLDYCQALRDLPANSTPALDENGQLTGVNWPTPPEN